jgi:hypothetical protein
MVLFNFLILKVLAINYGFKARLRFFDLLRRGTTIKVNSNVQLISVVVPLYKNLADNCPS